MKKIKLTKEEQEIERDINAGLYIPLSSEKRKLVERAMRKARKDEGISMRMYAPDLYTLKQMAAEEGLPYQTFISSILHKYTTHRLVDAAAIKRVVGVLKAK